MNTQINIALPREWKEELERLARVFSVEEENTLTYLDLIRRAIKEKYGLEEIESGIYACRDSSLELSLKQEKECLVN